MSSYDATPVQHRLNPTDNDDTATVEVNGYPDGEGQWLTDNEGVRTILDLWVEQGDADRSYLETVSHDFVLAYSDGSGLSLDEWPESGDGTYYLDDAPVVRA